MTILGLMMVRNGETMLQEALDRMAEYCYAVFVLDDLFRSPAFCVRTGRVRPCSGGTPPQTPLLSLV